MKTQLGHYDIVAELGRGGMGVVYKGYEPSLNRYVAIKVLAESLAHDESVKERFLREARSMASLNDPHIIQIYFIGEHEGQTFFVMEFVEGESLGSMLKRDGRLRPEQAARVIYQTALGLSTAHDKGVIHRDIKPGNLMVNSRGAIKIADFGIALVTQDFSKKLTSTGEFVGTPGYLSPEVCLGKPVDQRSDIFSLGIVLFEMLTGRMPFTDESPLGLMLEVVRADIPDVRQLNADVDPELSRILAKMIAKDPADRYQSCQDLAGDLARHPLIAGNTATINLKPQISTAAATVFGMKTPVSGQRPLPVTQPTPRPGSLNAGTQASALPTPPPAPRQSVLDRSTSPGVPGARKSSALPWAIAAVLLIALGGGAYAFRSQIPFLNSSSTATAQTASTTTPPAVTPPAATVTPPATTTQGTTASTLPATTTAQGTTASTLPATTTASATVDPNAASTAATTPASTTSIPPSAPSTPPVSDPTATASTLPAANPATSTTSPTAPPSPPVVDPNAQNVASVPATTGADGPAPRASNVDALKDLAAARASADAPGPRIAKVSPPESPSAPPEPKIPTIAVIAGGDSAIAGPARQEVTRALQRAGFNVIDGGRAHDDNEFDSGRLSGRANAVVVVYVRPVGQQVLTYYGQASTLYTAQISMRAFAVRGRRALGAGWTEQVNFTSLNATDKAREAIEPMADDMAQALDEYRSKRGRG